jgi:hypothetical protein
MQQSHAFNYISHQRHLLTKIKYYIPGVLLVLQTAGGNSIRQVTSEVIERDFSDTVFFLSEMNLLYSKECKKTLLINKVL